MNEVAAHRATVVLVHGAAHGAWSWDRVVPGLRQAGIPTIAIDLPGHGQDTGPLTDLHGDAVRVTEVLDTVEGPVVLVGHSYGGAVITEAGIHPSVVRLVFIAAVAPDADESAGGVSAAGPQFPDPAESGIPTLRSGFRPSADGSAVTMDPEVAAAVFYSECPAEGVEWALGLIGPQGLAALGQTPNAVAWRTKPSTFAVCANDRTIHPELQRQHATRCSDSVEWATGHSPNISRPELIVELSQHASRPPTQDPDARDGRLGRSPTASTCGHSSTPPRSERLGPRARSVRAPSCGPVAAVQRRERTGQRNRRT